MKGLLGYLITVKQGMGEGLMIPHHWKTQLQKHRTLTAFGLNPACCTLQRAFTFMCILQSAVTCYTSGRSLLCSRCRTLNAAGSQIQKGFLGVRAEATAASPPWPALDDGGTNSRRLVFCKSELCQPYALYNRHQRADWKD